MGFNITPAVRNLIIINILIALLGFGGLKIADLLSLRNINSEGFAPYQFFSYMFAHGGFGHILFNMLGLFFFGPMLEKIWGPQKFVFFYIFCGVGAAFIYSGVNYYEIYQIELLARAYVLDPNPDSYTAFIYGNVPTYLQDIDFINNFAENPNDFGLIERSKIDAVSFIKWKTENSYMLGASGAVLGVVTAFGLINPNHEIYLMFIPIPIKAKYLVIFYAAYSVYAGIQKTPGDNVAHFAHLGGMIFALILIQYWKYNGNKFY